MGSSQATNDIKSKKPPVWSELGRRSWPGDLKQERRSSTGGERREGGHTLRPRRLVPVKETRDSLRVLQRSDARVFRAPWKRRRTENYDLATLNHTTCHSIADQLRGLEPSQGGTDLSRQNRSTDRHGGTQTGMPRTRANFARFDPSPPLSPQGARTLLTRATALGRPESPLSGLVRYWPRRERHHPCGNVDATDLPRPLDGPGLRPPIVADPIAGPVLGRTWLVSAEPSAEEA